MWSEVTDLALVNTAVLDSCILAVAQAHETSLRTAVGYRVAVSHEHAQPML